MGDLLDKFLKLEETKKKPEKEITPEIIKIPIKPKNQKFKICPTCNKRNIITREKTMNKDELITWFKNYINENKDNFPLDWLRGQKLTFESINEMRK